ncbi:MAG: methanogenesis marker 8 protein [Candidatus Syntropharchaeia archaeon]
MPHVVELFGKTRVVIENGKVSDVGEPKIEWCPLVGRYRGIKKLTPELAREVVEYMIKDFGAFTPNRKFDLGVLVGFGASETMMTGIRRGIIDASVCVCDGAGTVITSNPELVQGIGARLPGVIETEPIREIISEIEKKNGFVLDPENASIDQIGGVKKASELGYKRIAVTVTDSETAKEIRKIESESGIEVTIIGVHTTGMKEKEVEEFLKYVDITTACASAHMRRLAKPLLQAGISIPLFAITQRGKELLIERAKEVESPLLIHTTETPLLEEDKQPFPLV